MARSSELKDTGMIESPSHDRLRRPSYAAAEAGRLVGLTAERVRRWLRGYGYSYGDAVRGQPPVVRQGRGLPSPYASFLDLVDLLFVKRFLDHGVSLQKVRRALDEAREVLGTNHFARQTFFTDGGAIFLRLKEGAQEGRGVVVPVFWTRGRLKQPLESSAWTTSFATPSSSSSQGTTARMEEGVATTGSPALLLAHSRVIGMHRNR